MALTRVQALRSPAFHVDADNGKCDRWRRNGNTQTWKTRPDDFRIPVVYGLRNYGQVTPANADRFHAEEDCPHGNG